MPPDPKARPPLRPRRGGRVWLWFIAAVMLHFAAWTAWFTIASRHPVAEVPLATAARP